MAAGSLQGQVPERTPSGVAYDVTGAGPVVVFVHAFSLDRRMWDAQGEALRDRYTVVRYDQRGHGDTPAPDAPYAPHQDLLDVLTAVRAERAVVVGLSSGASIAVDAALAAPDRVAGLVLAAPAVGGYQPTGSFDWMAPVVEAARQGDPMLAAERWAATALMAAGGEGLAVRQMVLDNAGLWAMSGNPAIPLEPPAIDRLATVEVPVLVIVGAHDTEDTRRVASILRERVPQVRVEYVDGAGHLVSLAAPDHVDRLLEDYLRKVWPSRRGEPARR